MDQVGARFEKFNRNLLINWNYSVSEKQQLLSVEDYGDTMAAVQGLLKKHDAFETDFAAHRDRCTDISAAGEQLIADKNHHSDSIGQRCQQLKVKGNIIFLFNTQK